MDIFSNQQKTLLKSLTKEGKKDLKVFKKKCVKKASTAKKKKTGSSGERLIEKYLLKNRIEFVKEYPLPEISKNKMFPLRLDF